MEFLMSNFAPIMFAGLIVFLLLGFPVAFSLGACGLFFGFVGIEAKLLNVAFLFLDGIHKPFLRFPAGTHLASLLFEIGYFGTQRSNTFFIALPLDGFSFDLQLFYFTFNFINFLRYRVDFQPQTAGRFINQVDGLIGQKTIGYIAL